MDLLEDYINKLDSNDGKFSSIENFPYKSRMESCIQDPIYHAEGDVWTHTELVYAQVLDKCPNIVEKYAALYHDVAKPETRTEEPLLDRIKISHPNHSRFGAQRFWKDAYINSSLDLETRLKIYYLIKWHQRVFHMWSKDDMEKLALEYITQGNEWKTLIDFAHCDNLGRICPDHREASTSLELLLEWIYESNFQAWTWPNATTRVEYFENENRNLFYTAVESAGSNVFLFSGLPGSGKDTYYSKFLSTLPVISLDDIRKTLKISSTDNQGTVIQHAKELAKQYLRKGVDFVWNATNITRSNRSRIISICRAYNATINIVAFDINYSKIKMQNCNRPAVVPINVIHNMIEKWEPPSLTECHSLTWIRDF